MQTLTVQLQNSYDIHIQRGILQQCGEQIAAVHPRCQAFIITDSHVAPLYLPTVEQSLQQAGFSTNHLIFTAGEQSKLFDTIYDMVCAMADARMTRSDIVIALGGGVTGDMAGFASAIYMRGIPFAQLSTSLLSDIDSSVGGKTGCDLKNGKNLVGSFHQPALVLIDPDTLQTLPKRYISDGMAEAIKYGVIRDASLFTDIQTQPLDQLLDRLLYTCIDIKRQIVEDDPFEHGRRKLLNFGHTLGHAIEKYYHFERYSHGEAVCIGMVQITKAASYLEIQKMKKTLLALATLSAMAGSAFAADVTLYGLVDYGFDYVHQDFGGSDYDNDTFQMKSGMNSGSRFGLKGSEDLGNGLTVGFVLENGFNADDGTMDNNSRLFGRESQLYVQGAFGTVSFGRVGKLISALGSYGLMGKFSVFSGGWGSYTGGKYFHVADWGRMDNTITYRSPDARHRSADALR